MIHERSPVRTATHHEAAMPAGLWADVWRYAYWIVLDRGLASLIAQWVAHATEGNGDPTLVRVACLSTTRRIALGMGREGASPRAPFDDGARIAALPRGQREVLVLRNLIGLRDAEIAVVMGCQRHNLPHPPRPQHLFGADPATAPRD